MFFEVKFLPLPVAATANKIFGECDAENTAFCQFRNISPRATFTGVSFTLLPNFLYKVLLPVSPTISILRYLSPYPFHSLGIRAFDDL